MSLEQEKAQRKYQWIPDPRDKRDFQYTTKRQPETPLPETVDLRARCGPVEDQGTMGSCTANALAGNMEFLEDLERSERERLSRMFVYYNERKIEGDPQEDRGAKLRDGIKALKLWGICRESDWPYTSDLVYREPSPQAYKDAAENKISRYERLHTLAEMKDCLASGFPFVFGFVVYPSFESEEVARTGTAAMPDPFEKPLGGHAVLAVGYDDRRKFVIAKNSWGPHWGENGYFTLPYEYLTQGLAGDFWSIQK